jgi:hypothetical protein
VLNGTWNQGRLVIDPTRDVTIQFNATAGWGATGAISYAYLSLWEGDGDDIIGVNRISTEEAGPINIVTIPARAGGRPHLQRRSPPVSRLGDRSNLHSRRLWIRR